MKIQIRLAREKDVLLIAKLKDELLIKGFNIYMGSNRLTDKAKISSMKKSARENKKNEFGFVAIDQEKNKLVGHCGFKAARNGRKRHRGTLGWIVHPDYTGKGIGTKLLKSVIEEARARKYKRLEAEIAVKNIASVKLAKRAGFKVEGKKEKGLLLDNGKYVDTYVVGKIIK